MELETLDQPEVTRLRGNESFAMVADDKIRIQTKDVDGEWVDALDEKVPNGKTWDLYVTVSINQRDAG